MTDHFSDQRADRVAARATGFGAGLIAFMVAWTLGARIFERVIDGPGSAYTAMAFALVVGFVTTVWMARRLLAGLRAQPGHDDPAATLQRAHPSATS